MKRRPTNRRVSDRSAPPRTQPQPSTPKNPRNPNLNSTTLSVLGGVFILGIGIGVALSKTTTITPTNVASIQTIDQSAPNPEFCVQFGASAIAVDSRVFVTFNPFTIFISQPVMQPGCVMRINNIAILEQRKLISSEQLRECRQRMNTFGFTGALEGTPQVSCIYQSNDDKNKFIAPGGVEIPSETNNF
jgi:hypothetical protein